MEVKKIPKKTVTLIEPKRSVLVDKEKYHQKHHIAGLGIITQEIFIIYHSMRILFRLNSV